MFASGLSVLYYIDHYFEENFRLLYDTKGRFYLHNIVKEEASYKLCRVNVVMIAAGNSMGRVGVIQHRDRHPGSFEIIHVKDAVGHTFATRLQNVFGSARATSLGSRYLRGMVSS